MKKDSLSKRIPKLIFVCLTWSVSAAVLLLNGMYIRICRYADFTQISTIQPRMNVRLFVWILSKEIGQSRHQFGLAAKSLPEDIGCAVKFIIIREGFFKDFL